MARRIWLFAVSLAALFAVTLAAGGGYDPHGSGEDTFTSTIDFQDTGGGGDVPTPEEDSPHGGPSVVIERLRTGALSCTFRLTSEQGYYYNMAYVARISTPNESQQIGYRSYSYNTPSLSGGVAADPVADIYGDYVCTVEWSVNGYQATTDRATLHVSPNCGDARNALIMEYTDRDWKPTCSDFVSSANMYTYSWSTYLQDCDYPWGAVKSSVNDHINQVCTAMGSSPTMTSGFRNPARQDILSPGAPNGRHIWGDAVDLSMVSDTLWNSWKAQAKLAVNGGACVEPRTRTASWIHIDYRGSCPVDW